MPYQLIAFNATDPQFDFGSVHNFIVNCSSFRRWWHEIPLTYVVDTHLDTRETTNLLRPTLRGAPYLVTELNPAALDGWLPHYAWEWFYPSQQQTLDLGETKDTGRYLLK